MGKKKRAKRRQQERNSVRILKQTQNESKRATTKAETRSESV